MFRWVPLSIIGGLTATILWTLIIISNKYYQRKKAFGHLEGTYAVKDKYSNSKESTKTKYNVKITKNGNKIEIKSIDLNNGKWTGYLELEEVYRLSGKGYYDHIDKIGNKLWGYIDIFINKNENTLLVHTYYVNQNRELIYQAEIYEKNFN